MAGASLDTRVAFNPDGRLPGAARGASIGDAAPEAFDGGPIALVRDGDEIEIDIPGRSLNLLVSTEELEERAAAWVPREPRYQSGLLSRYVKLVHGADEGAVVS